MTAEPKEIRHAATDFAHAARPAAYEPHAVLTLVMTRLAQERVPIDIKSAGRALEAAGRLLEVLGVEPTDELIPSNVLPFVPRQRGAVDR